MYSLKRIQEIAAAPAPILSVYLNTANQNPSSHPVVPTSLRWFTDQVVELSHSLPACEEKKFKEQADRFANFLQSRHAEERAIVAFVGPDLWEILSFNFCLSNQLRWGTPSTGQLFQLLNQHKSYGVVVVDQHRARFFKYYLGQLTKLGEKMYDVDESQWKRTDVAHAASERSQKAHGPDPDLFEHRRKAQYEHLYSETATHAVALFKEYGFVAIFLVGHERLLASLQKKFPAPYAARLLPVTEDLGGFSSNAIRQRLEPLVTTHELERQSREVEQLLSAPRGAVTGPDETLARLQEGTIRTLIVAADRDFHLRECVMCGTVSRSSDSVCADCGGIRESISLLDALPRLATSRGTTVEFVEGAATEQLVAAGGIGGWLRQATKNVAG